MQCFVVVTIALIASSAQAQVPPPCCSVTKQVSSIELAPPCCAKFKIDEARFNNLCRGQASAKHSKIDFFLIQTSYTWHAMIGNKIGAEIDDATLKRAKLAATNTEWCATTRQRIALSKDPTSREEVLH